MWPKAFAQFIELAPHISRLLPMADRFFQSKAAADDTQRKSLDALADTVTSRLSDFTAENAQQLAQITSAAAQQVSQLGALTQRLERAANDAQAARLTAESLDGRLTRIESRQAQLSTLLIGVLILLVLMLVLVAYMAVRTR